MKTIPIEAVRPAALRWPADDFSRVPYEIFHDLRIYQEEMQRLFHGPTWNYLGLEVEIPNWGDFLTTWVGDTHVIVTRAKNGAVHAFENTCAHRGSRIVDTVRGNAKRHTCPYHLWNYNLAGELTALPLEKGHNGKGGMPPCFDKKDHGLRKLRVAICGGLIFGTYSEQTEELQAYLGPHSLSQIDRLLVQRKPKVIGYLRQKIPSNWKLYNENVRDPYHASLLHLFQVSFGIQTPAMQGGIKMDKEGKNTWNHSILSEQDAKSREGLTAAYADTGKFMPDLELADPSLAQVKLDLDDNYKTTILSMFPTLIVAQVDNTYAIRHLRPKGPDAVELHITYLGFENDTPQLLHNRLLSVNFIGPAGYISLEDGEALRLVQEGTKSLRSAHSVLEMGGIGEINDTDYMSQEISIRGFWRHYHRVMQFPPAGHADTREAA
ncbi:aromatic ring-hydroxylating oxygenase subunit alpha [Verminephrobacter aporrectodeae]|uniref:aromatic ring-hydroxylating oxygenase subunit alpha n=1 Tax=Verminephrobacter aporrectodeae TaxID=1110389 RepID=UPI0022448D08|nr:Rieske 2Fe-2S domain-containing protein [Verminephrobacter aporrectodeae]MCW8174984.1 Rieske (2Fe-2S) protein [Verminephrobacter aporrectodeae subsp. tuberculatae]MCW8201581.1 Rieske (2Fe-2S) protein [Verminephrobacter aporrectodeae subsp. tuberculatae]